MHVLPVYGGQGYGVQLSALRRGVHIVVGTPGRIMDHLEKGTLDLRELRFLVLDEADEMLKMGFAEDVETILADTPDDKHVALFSATMPSQIRRISKKYLDDPVEVTVKATTSTTPNITQRYLMVSYPQKVDALTRILEVENFEGMIVFVRTKNETETLAEKLRARGFSAMAINGDIAQNAARAHRRPAQVGQARHPRRHRRRRPRARRRADQPRRQLRHPDRHRVLRPPHRPHRPGRAAAATPSPSSPRASATCSRPSRRPRASRSTPMSLPTVEDINATRLTRFDDAITAALSTDELDFFRDVIAHYVNEHDVPEVDVAAALAVVLQGDEPMLLEPEPEPARRARPRRPPRRP